MSIDLKEFDDEDSNPDDDDLPIPGYGNDTLQCGAGNDYLYGGSLYGNDYYYLSNGNDTYLFARGSGSDTLIAFTNNSGR